MILNLDMTTSNNKRRAKFTLWLINDSVNTMKHVCEVIGSTVPGYNVLRAEQVALIAHHKGKAELCNMFRPDIYTVQAALLKYGLSVRVTQKKTKY